MYRKGFICIHQDLISVRKNASGFNFLQLSTVNVYYIINRQK